MKLKSIGKRFRYALGMKRILFHLLLLIGMVTASALPASADEAILNTAIDQLNGYERTLFKHWIDADKDGCDTRAEVLIDEAILKPKIGPKCKLTGGKWFSVYDGNSLTNASLLDIDHLVPLAEAWRSGAWKWTSTQRQAFANDLENSEALNAVSLKLNRSKGDKDLALWMPVKEQCAYTKNWISLKVKYSLSVDADEARKLNSLIQSCGLTTTIIPLPTPTLRISPNPDPSQCINSLHRVVSVSAEDKIKLFELEKSLANYLKLNTKYTTSIEKALVILAETKSLKVVVCRGKYDSLPFVGATNAVENQVSSMFTLVSGLIGNIQKEIGESASSTGTSNPNQISTPNPVPSNPELVVTPGAFCSPAGATGKSTSGVSYTCKTSQTDTRNRWRT